MPAPRAEERAGWGAGVRRPPGEEAAVSRAVAGREMRGYGAFVSRHPPGGEFPGGFCVRSRTPEESSVVAARAERDARAGCEPVLRMSTAMSAAGLAPRPRGDGGAGLGMSARCGS